MDRGKDATGVAWLSSRNGEVFNGEHKNPENNSLLRVWKMGKPASSFVKKEFWAKITQKVPNMMLMHCRAATTGSPNKNVNNHPIYNKRGMAVIHNGIIHNNDVLAKECGYHLDGEVDSEIILHLLNDGWWSGVPKTLNKLSGGFACAAIFAEKPGELMLFRHTNPLCVHMDAKRDILFFASVKGILKDSLGEYHRGFRLNSIETYELPDDQAILIDSNGVKDIKELKPKLYTTVSYSTDYDWETRRNWGKGSECGSKAHQQRLEYTGKYTEFGKYVHCPHCNMYLSLTEREKGKCETCQKELKSSDEKKLDNEAWKNQQCMFCTTVYFNEKILELSWKDKTIKICSDCFTSYLVNGGYTICPHCNTSLMPWEIDENKCSCGKAMDSLDKLKVSEEGLTELATLLEEVVKDKKGGCGV